MIIGSTVWGPGRISTDEINDAILAHIDSSGVLDFGMFVSRPMLGRIVKAYEPMIRSRDDSAPGISMIRTDYGQLIIGIDDTLDPDVMEFRTTDA